MLGNRPLAKAPFSTPLTTRMGTTDSLHCCWLFVYLSGFSSLKQISR